MRGLFIHAVVFGVLNGLLVLLWLVTTGSTDVLGTAPTDPLQAWRGGMWPLAPIAAWGGGLVIHAAVVVTFLPRRINRRLARHLRAVQRAKSARRSHGRDGLPEPRQRPHAPARQWIAAMFTDLVNSTDLAERFGDDAWRELLSEHRGLVRRCISEHRGTEVGTQGDGFLVRFDSPDAAVQCAVSIQQSMDQSRASGAFTPELRVGIHAGEAVADDNDLVGRVINLAARVTSAAEPSEILVTEPVADHLEPGVRIVDRGLVPLKGVAAPRHLLAVDWRLTAQPDAAAPGRSPTSLS